MTITTNSAVLTLDDSEAAAWREAYNVGNFDEFSTPDFSIGGVDFGHDGLVLLLIRVSDNTVWRLPVDGETSIAIQHNS